jgi:UV DNA damage endonuclease
MERQSALEKVSGLVLENVAALQQALAFCANNGIGAFRISSDILPIKTHPQAGYEVEELPHATEIVQKFRACGAFAREHDLRLSMHPGQFTLLSSADEGVTRRSLADIEYHAEVAQWVSADVINIHGGGAYGDKAKALGRVAAHLELLSEGARSRLTLENDDTVYTPSDLLPLCWKEGVPFVYDVHHHRVLVDGQTVAEVTEAALETWNREPHFHISTPREGWDGPKPYRHHDYVNPNEFPERWKRLAQERDLTVDVEAKAKELAVLALLHTMRREGVPT